MMSVYSNAEEETTMPGERATVEIGSCSLAGTRRALLDRGCDWHVHHARSSTVHSAGKLTLAKCSTRSIYLSLRGALRSLNSHSSI